MAGLFFGAMPLTNSDEAVQPVLLEDLDASVGSGPEVPEDEIAVRYDSDEALLAAIQQRRNARAKVSHRLCPRLRADIIDNAEFPQNPHGE